MKLQSHDFRLMSALLLGACLAAPARAQVTPEAGPPVVGIGHKHTIPSRILGEKVDLVVHLPADYSSSEQQYPILLLLGSDYRAKFALAAATLDYMTAQGQLPGIVLVGVDLPHGNFVLVPQEKAGGTASADRHIATLAEEILPFVDRTFRTNSYRVLYGGSNSGVGSSPFRRTSPAVPCSAGARASSPRRPRRPLRIRAGPAGFSSCSPATTISDG